MSTLNTQNLTNKVALITGGGTGIGRAIALDLIGRGAKVVVTGRREAPLEALKQAHPESVDFVVADVAKHGDSQRVVGEVINRLGQLDILVNNAATLNGVPLVEQSDEDIDRVLITNVSSVLRWSRDAIPHLTKTHGVIINISSTMGHRPVAMSVYSSTKAAVEHVSRVLAVELGSVGIRVNAVAPGLTQTDMAADVMESPMGQQMLAMTPLGRVGQPVDVARVVGLLASPAAGWVTGQVLDASGGLMQ